MAIRVIQSSREGADLIAYCLTNTHYNNYLQCLKFINYRLAIEWEDSEASMEISGVIFVPLVYAIAVE